MSSNPDKPPRNKKERIEKSIQNVVDNCRKCKVSSVDIVRVARELAKKNNYLIEFCGDKVKILEF